MSIIKSALSALALTLTASASMAQTQNFDYTVDRFADIEVLRYQVPDFDKLSLDQKRLVYYLTEAALWGRDILWDQNYKYNLPLRQMLEAVYTSTDDRTSADFKAFDKYIRQVEFANGIHHHYSMDKFTPEFSREWLEKQVEKLPAGAWTPVRTEVMAAIFDPAVAPKRVNQAEGEDLILTSANNLYEGVTQAEVEDYYNALKNPDDATPVSYGLNSRVVKNADGRVVEQVYKLGGLYSDAIAHIIDNLTKAMAYAENDAQRAVIARLINYYTTGDLATFDDYSIRWAEDTDSQVDFINGFIESYGDL